MENKTRAILKAVSAYVPDLAVRHIMAPPGQGERIEAALLFADVSGFTAMSEGMARLGKEGAEELTRILNAYFSAMIELVQSYGGQVIKFGGDAITCAFTRPPTHPASDLHANVLRACGCALAMQEKTAEFRAVETKRGTFELRMKIGVSAGPVLSLSVGDRQEGLEYVLAGRPLDQAAEAEHRATAGEVVLDSGCITDLAVSDPQRGDDETCWEELGVMVGQKRGERFRPVKGLYLNPIQALALMSAAEETPQKADWHTLEEQAAQQIIAYLTPYLPPRVYEQILEGQRQFVGEHRPVVSLFVNFFGLDYDDDPEAEHKLQQYFTAVQSIIHRYGGRLNRVSTGDKGSMLHLIFGAPMAYEDSEERALGCALAMQRQIQESDELSFITDQRIGIASGDVFAGAVGSEQRREYTVMGDTVNLSARLMQAAGQGDILLERRTARHAEADFVCEALAPIRVKGKREPVAIYQAVGVRAESKVWGGEEISARRRALPIVGRERELAQIEHIIERVMAGQGQLLLITGEAGVGKSRLVEELIALARTKGMYGLGGDCLSYGSQTPYLPWIDLFNSLFGFGAARPAERIQKIAPRMALAEPALQDWAPLMGQLLGLPVPDNELTASLDAQLRKQRIFDITLTLLRHQAEQSPLFLIVFENVQWIDAISLEMLNHVARNIANHRILLVALHRPSIELTQWAQHDYYHHIELTNLPAENALELVRLKLGMEAVPAPLRERVLRGEARVNPFFVEEVVNSLLDRGYLALKGGNGGYVLKDDLSRVQIPDSVQALVMSRIDRLDESSRLTVKVASVIGRTFRYHTLQKIYPVDILPQRLRDNLDKLDRLDMTPLDKPAPEWAYIFKQIMTQEVAYESLLYVHRRELHHRVGEHLEQTYSDNLEEHYELLAHHYYQSGDQDKSWDYLVKAGDKAKDQYANDAAIADYNQALSLGVIKPDRARVHESLGDVHRLIGQYEPALENYRQALAHHPATAQVAEIWRKIAKTWELQGQYDEAMRYLDLTRASLGERKTPEMARIYNDQGWIAMLRGDYERALQWCARGLEVAEGLPDDEQSHLVRDELQHTLGTVHLRTGDYAQASADFEKCIHMRKESGNIYGMGRSYLNLAVVYWSQSDYALAARYIRESLEIFRKIGYAHGTAMCYNNLGGIDYTLGDYPQAIEHYEKSLEIRKEIGDVQGIADIYNNLGEVYHGLGDHPQAIHYLQQAVQLFTQIGDKMTLIDAHKLLAEVELELDNTDEALEHCQRSLEIAQEIGNREYEGTAYRVLGQIHRAAGRQQQAGQHLQHSVETLATTGNKLELGRSHYELGLTLSPTDEQKAREQLQQAVQIFEALGVEGELEKAQAALRQLNLS